MKKILYVIFTLKCMLLTLICNAQIITTVAGNGIGTNYIGEGGAATAAELNVPEGRVTFDAIGNFYWADSFYGGVRKVSTAGIITTITGNGNAQPGDGGLAINSSMYHIDDVAFDHIGNMYIVNNFDYTIRKINTSNIITTIAGVFSSYGYTGDGGFATNAQLEYPNGVACDASGNIYITSSNSVRKVDIATGIITTVAGDSMSGYSGDGGQATAARLNTPQGVNVDAAGNIYISDYNNHVIRKVNTAGIITTIAGNGFNAGAGCGGYSGDGGLATQAKLNYPRGGVAFDAMGNMYIAEFGNNRIRMVNTAGIISTIAGNGTGGFGGDGGLATAAEIYSPTGVAINAAGDMYISDSYNHLIRKVSGIGVTGISQITNNKPQFFVYPNPTSNYISLHIDNTSKSQNDIITIQNTLGQTVKKVFFNRDIDVSDLIQGYYIMKVTLQSGETYETKFIKQ